MHRFACAIALLLILTVSDLASAEAPSIRKLGTLDCDMVETTPVVFNGRLYRLEYVRENYHANRARTSCFRFIDVESGRATSAFASGYHFGSALVEGENVYVFGTDKGGGSKIAMFRSDDLEHWVEKPALNLAGWGLYNTSVCKVSEGNASRYVMAIEIGEPPEVVGLRFTMRFAESKDLLEWKLLPEQFVFAKDRYTACPALRHVGGHFYMTYLEARPGPNYETHLVRSKDLAHWESSPLNPVLRASDQDKQIANPALTAKQRSVIASAVNINNSDVDLCEFAGKTHITYSWGNQQGTEFLAAAVFDGTLEAFLTSFFADAGEPKEKLFVATPLTAKDSFTSGVEGPACDADGNVYAVNFEKQQTIGRITPAGKAEVFVTLPGQSTGNGIVFGKAGEMYVADYVGHNVLKIDPKTRQIAVFAHEERMNQPNDLAIAPDGTLYASDPAWKKDTGQVWRIDSKGKVTLAAPDMGTTNGIDLSPDGKTLYVNESVQRNIWAFTVAEDGSLKDKRLFKKFDDFGFDGMRCDVDGNLYVTRHGKGTVVKLSPKAEVLKEIDVLGEHPTNICFGGPDGRTAYVTEAKNQRIVQFRADRPGLAWRRFEH